MPADGPHDVSVCSARRDFATQLGCHVINQRRPLHNSSALTIPNERAVDPFHAPIPVNPSAEA